jgi:hypothetical protein
MTPTELVQLAEVKDLMKTSQYRRAIDKLTDLAKVYPNDPEIQALLRVCKSEDLKNTPQWIDNSPKKVVQTRVRLESIGFLVYFGIFLAVFLAIVLAWVLIFFVLGFHFEYSYLR